MALGGAILRIIATILRALELLCALVIVGVYGFYLSIYSTNKATSPVYMKAIIAMAGIAVIYTAFGLILTLCLAGVTFFSLLALILDICFIGVFVAIAYYSRKGTQTCTGLVDTPYGRADAGADIQIGDKSFQPDYKRVCTLQSVALAVAIIAIVAFLLSLVFQFLLKKHHKSEKKYGPSPSNNYTAGAGRKPFWKRSRRNKHATRDAELATAPGGVRHSHEVGYTGTGAGPRYGNAATNY